MIREISWYLDDGRFASLAQELEGAVRAYAAARGGSPAAALRFREDARGLFERHCVQSGLRGAENSFINIDAEFFDGQKMNEAALEDFIRNIIKAHCYQKVLWTYMGTTGSLSPVTETHMRGEGRRFESLFPLSCVPPGKSRRGRKAGDNTVEMYLYADGKAGSGYIPEKALHRFDVLEDTSGVNWNRGYDPAGTIACSGWHGAFDDGGVWVRVDETSAGALREGKAPGEGAEAGTLLVIRDGEHAILYDPENILVSPAALFYFTGAGEPYGRLDADLEKTTEGIRVAMKEMGLSRIKEIACTAAASPETAAAYRAVLKDHVSPAFAITEAASLFARITRIDKSRNSGGKHKNTAGKRESREGLPADVRAAGERAGSPPALAEDPSVRGRAGRAGTNLRACSKTHLKSGIWAPSQRFALETGLSAPSPRICISKSCGLSASIPGAPESPAAAVSEGGAASAVSGVGEASGPAAGRARPGAPEFPAATISEGGALSAASVARSAASPEKQNMHGALSAASGAGEASGPAAGHARPGALESPAAAVSEGGALSAASASYEVSPISEARGLSSLSHTSFAPHKSGAGEASGPAAGLTRPGVPEFPAAAVSEGGAVSGAGEASGPAAGHARPGAPESPAVAVSEGGALSAVSASYEVSPVSGAPAAPSRRISALGIPLSEKGFDAALLSEKYGYTAAAARKAGEFFHDILLREDLPSPGLFALTAVVEKAVRQGAGKSFATLRKNILAILDGSEKEYSGFVFMREGGQSPGTGVAEKPIPHNPPDGSGIRRLVPIYRSAEWRLPLKRTSPPGFPEALRPPRFARSMEELIPGKLESREEKVISVAEPVPGGDVSAVSAARDREPLAKPETAPENPALFTSVLSPIEGSRDFTPPETTSGPLPAARPATLLSSRKAETPASFPEAPVRQENPAASSVFPAVPVGTVAISAVSVKSPSRDVGRENSFNPRAAQTGCARTETREPLPADRRADIPANALTDAGGLPRFFFHGISARGTSVHEMSAREIDVREISAHPRGLDSSGNSAEPPRKGRETGATERFRAFQPPVFLPDKEQRVRRPEAAAGHEGLSVEPGVSGSPVAASRAAMSPGFQQRDAELERLRRIEENYERDRAALARERQPLLARSAIREPGSADGSTNGGVGPVEADAFEIKRMNDKFGRLIKEALNENL